MSDPKLLPCPFCGGNAGLYFQLDDLDDWVVMCDVCGVRSCPEGIRYDRELAITDWNTRVAPAEGVAL
jgi:Lar family restriction alleviation protein